MEWPEGLCQWKIPVTHHRESNKRLVRSTNYESLRSAIIQALVLFPISNYSHVFLKSLHVRNIYIYIYKYVYMYISRLSFLDGRLMLVTLETI